MKRTILGIVLGLLVFAGLVSNSANAKGKPPRPTHSPPPVATPQG